MKRLLVIILLGLFSTTVFWGCGPTYTGAVIEPYKTYIDKPGKTMEHQVVGEIAFRKVGFNFLGIPIFTPDIIASLERKRQNLSADAVKNVCVYSDGLFMPLLMFPTYRVTATPIRYTGGM